MGTVKTAHSIPRTAPILARGEHLVSANEALAPLQQQDGGHSFAGGVVFPIERDEPDEPITTPEQAEGWARAGLWFLAAVTLFCAGMAVLAAIRSFIS